MARIKAKARPVIVAANDPTPERHQHGPSVPVDPNWEAGEERTVLKVRQFRTTKIDLLYHCGGLTWSMWRAGNWWLEKCEAGLGLPRVCADYGQSTGGGSKDPSPIPLSDMAEAARKALTAAKRALSLPERMGVEDALDDPHPPLTGRASVDRANRWRTGLQALAVHLRLAY